MSNDDDTDRLFCGRCDSSPLVIVGMTIFLGSSNPEIKDCSVADVKGVLASKRVFVEMEHSHAAKGRAMQREAYIASRGFDTSSNKKNMTGIMTMMDSFQG